MKIFISNSNPIRLQNNLSKIEKNQVKYLCFYYVINKI